MLRMDVQTFVSKVTTLALRFPMSITSWGRTMSHNAAVGGDPNSRHLHWCAVDLQLDHGANTERFKLEAKRMGLSFVDEGDHIHLQDSWEEEEK